MPRNAARSSARTSPEYFIAFSLHGACITFYDDHYSRFRAGFISGHDRVEGMVHAFSEYTNGYQRLTSIRPATPDDTEHLGKCERRPLGIGVPFSCNNIYHQVSANHPIMR
jgi:hypothetical protein